MTDVAAILDGYFAGGTVPATLYMGFVSGDNFESYNRGVDSMSSHPGWEEFTDYDEATRPVWTPGTTIDGVVAAVNNPGNTEITPNAEGAIVGVFLTDNNTVGGTTGQLYGPYPLDEGTQQTQIGVAFRAKIRITLELN